MGIGGMRALTALDIQPTICHMNEGHSAFMAFERTRMLMQQNGCDYWHAREATAAGNLFTTHTPVPAGFDMFPPDLLGRYFGGYIGQLGITFNEFMNLGRYHEYNTDEKFNMAIMALRHAHHVNGVSKLHGKVTRRMVQIGFPQFPEEEVPVSSVTNGIHARSFTSREMANVLDRYLGGRWSQDVSGEGVWEQDEQHPGRGNLAREAASARTTGAVCARTAETAVRAAGHERVRNPPDARNPAPGRADHRLRPPLRHLQARYPPAVRPGTADNDC